MAKSTIKYNKTDFHDYVEVGKKFTELRNVVCDKITEIYNCIGELFGSSINDWHFAECGLTSDTYFDIRYLSWNKLPDDVVAVEWLTGWNEIPVEYLYLTKEDLIKELKQNFIEYANEVKKIDNTKQQALKKLTLAEKEALGV